jgi:hypothetical protein
MMSGIDLLATVLEKRLGAGSKGKLHSRVLFASAFFLLVASAFI